MLARDFALKSSDHFQVIFVCLDEMGVIGTSLRDQGYVVEVLQRRPGLDMGSALRLSAILRRYHVDLIHAHQYTPFFYSALARFLSGRIPILFTEHGRHAPDYRRPKRIVANRFLLRPYDRLVGVANCVRDALVRNEGFPADRISVTYNGVDASPYTVGRCRRNDVRAEFQVAPQDLVIMQVARLNRLKSHTTAIHALAHLIPQFPNLRLILVGEGEERETIEDLIANLNLESHVKLLGLRDDIPRLLEAADVFLLSSITEGLALTLIEAMLAQLPCVATRVGGNVEVVREGETGFLVEPSNPACLAQALQRILASPELRVQMGNSGRQRAIALFDDRKMHQAYHQIYNGMLGLPSVSPQE